MSARIRFGSSPSASLTNTGGGSDGIPAPINSSFHRVGAARLDRRSRDCHGRDLNRSRGDAQLELPVECDVEMRARLRRRIVDACAVTETRFTRGSQIVIAEVSSLTIAGSARLIGKSMYRQISAPKVGRNGSLPRGVVTIIPKHCSTSAIPCTTSPMAPRANDQSADLISASVIAPAAIVIPPARRCLRSRSFPSPRRLELDRQAARHLPAGRSRSGPAPRS